MNNSKSIVVGVVGDQFGNIQRGGAETQLDKTCEYLSKTGVVEIVPIGQNNITLDNIDLVHFFKSKPYYTSLTKILNEKGIPYVVSTISYPTNLKSVILYQSIIKRFPSRVRNLFQTGQIFELWNGAAKLYPNTTAEAEYLRYFNSGDKIEIVPNGIDILELSQMGSIELFFKKYPQIKTLDRFILNVGRIEQRKNQKRLLAACERAHIPLVLIGKIGDQNYYDELIRSRSEYLYYLGPEYDRNILYGAYKACTIFCLPSMIETPGIVALEAGFYNKPVIITSKGGTQDYFDDKVLYVEPNSIDSIEKAISQMLSTPLSTRNQVCSFTWEAIAKQYVSSYCDILGRN